MSSVLWIIVLVIGFDLLIVPLILTMVIKGMWGPFAERYPAKPIAKGAVQRNFQSYKIDMLNLGFMLHTAVDEHYLHLLPAKFGRMLGMQPASVPWEAIEPVRLWRKKYAKVKIGKNKVLGPAWALGLAFEAEDSAQTP